MGCLGPVLPISGSSLSGNLRYICMLGEGRWEGLKKAEHELLTSWAGQLSNSHGLLASWALDRFAPGQTAGIYRIPPVPQVHTGAFLSLEGVGIGLRWWNQERGTSQDQVNIVSYWICSHGSGMRRGCLRAAWKRDSRAQGGWRKPCG